MKRVLIKIHKNINSMQTLYIPHIDLPSHNYLQTRVEMSKIEKEVFG